ncbi:guanylate-binding protein 4 isoform X1 [Caretta caretta]|uniref:guanylate-binding protein 4 isoform X1 n=1 Tax=Caretta caretta TaxID=8467 RepID=UPI003F4BDDFE
MGTIENEAAVREALAHYVAGMRGLRVPAELGELLAMHGTCEEDALRLFVQRSFKDEGYTYQKRLMPSPSLFSEPVGWLVADAIFLPGRDVAKPSKSSRAREPHGAGESGVSSPGS